MIIKKQFALHEYTEEEAYLNKMAQEGKCLKKALGDSYEFEECASYDNKYKVVYSFEAFDSEIYEGFKLVTTYTSSKGGYYYYLLIEDPTAELAVDEARNYTLQNNLNRIDRFNGIIIGSLFILFIYLYINYKNPLYFIIIVAAMALGTYVFKLRSKIKKAIT